MFRTKLPFAVLALALLADCTQPLHAAPILANLNVDGAVTLLTQTTVAGVQEFAYIDLVTNVANTMLTTFLATYADIGGIGVLNVTDTCVQVTVVFTAPVACQTLAFSFTDVAFADVVTIQSLGTASVGLVGSVADVNFGAGVGGGSATLNFSNTPTVTPEPASLALLSTGLLAVAGVVRRRTRKSI